MKRLPVITAEQLSEGLGAFDELEYLGGGTFGDTYRAVRGDDEFALKVIHVEGLPDYLWQREIEALRRVEHPNVVGFIDCGRFRLGTRDYPYLRCEYVSGGDIQRAVEAGARPTTQFEIRQLLTGLLAGVGEIHDLGILHRDIKPANVALRDGDWGQPVLLDFGLARVLDMSSHTEMPAHVGTARYMAPEQLRASPARRRSDLFSTGVVVFEAVTGHHPFAEAGVAMTIQSLHDRIRTTTPPDPVSFNEACTAGIARVLLRMIAYNAHERLSVAVALRDLESDDGRE